MSENRKHCILQQITNGKLLTEYEILFTFHQQNFEKASLLSIMLNYELLKIFLEGILRGQNFFFLDGMTHTKYFAIFQIQI